MASSTYGRKLNPYRRLRDPLGVKGVRQSVVVTNNPSSIDQNQQLLVRFPNLGAHDVVVPGTARLAFTVSLTSTDANRTIVKNVGRAVVKKTTIKISGNEVLSIDDSDVLHCYQDLWKTAQERRNSQYQGIDLSDDSTVTRIRVGAGNKDETETEDAAIAAAYGNRYHIPLDFELLESHMPFYQSALGDRLEYELTFNEYSRVVVATGDAAASYSIDNIALEFDMVTQPDLARQIRNQYAGRLAVLYERVLRHRKITANKSDTLWNINLNVPARSMSGILMLFEEPAAAFQRDTEAFCNPKIEKVEVCIEGIPNQLYSQGMRAYQLWGEARKHFAAGTKRHPEVAAVAKDLALADVSLGQFLTSKHALWPTTTSSTAVAAGLRMPQRVSRYRLAKRRRPPAHWTSISTSSWTHSSTSRMADSSRHSTRLARSAVSLSQLLPTDPHSAIICGQTGCGKTVFVLDLLEGPYRGVFRHIVILCPTARHNKTYQERSWIWKDPEIFIVDPGERLHDYLRALYQCFEGEPTLYLIDDCAATKALTKKKDMLSELAFSGRHAGASVWVLTQKFNAVRKDLREQTKWVALFHCKDRDSFEDCLRENDVIPTREERAAVRQLLAETKHAKLVLKTDQPAAYQVLCWA